MTTKAKSARHGTSKVRRMRGKPGDADKKKVARAIELRAQGESYDSIAEKTGLPKSTVRYHVSHAEVLEERRAHWAKTHPRRQDQSCTGCGQSGHNVSTCPEKSE